MSRTRARIYEMSNSYVNEVLSLTTVAVHSDRESVVRAEFSRGARCGSQPGFLSHFLWGIAQGVYPSGKRVSPFLRREDDHLCRNGDNL